MERIVQDGECLDTPDRDYHQFVAAYYQRAQAALQVWLEYVAQKYNLSPGDQVSPDGRILRQVDQTPPPAPASD